MAATELLDKRGRTRKCFRRDDGRLEYRIQTGPVHWDAGGVWEEFDLRWAEQASGLWVPSASDVVMALEDNVLSFTTPLGHTVSYEVPDRISTALVDEETVLITASQGSIAVRNHPNGVRQSVTCNMKQNKVWALTYPTLLSEGCVFEQVGPQCVAVVTPDGERLNFVVSEAISADGSHHPEAVTLTVYKGDLRLWVDDTGLEAPYTVACPDTFYTDTGDGYLSAQHATYTIAADMSAPTVFNSQSVMNAGQYYLVTTNYCFEAFLSFDTSTLAGTVTEATLALYLASDYSTTDFDVQARAHAWGGTLESADGVPDHSLSSKTLLATKNTAPTWATDAYTDLTSESAFLNAVDVDGDTEMLLCSSRHVGDPGTAPTTWEYLAAHSANNTYPPRLTVVCGVPPVIDAAQSGDDIQVSWS